jgi:hypothetical protein
MFEEIAVPSKDVHFSCPSSPTLYATGRKKLEDRVYRPHLVELSTLGADRVCKAFFGGSRGTSAETKLEAPTSLRYPHGYLAVDKS